MRSQRPQFSSQILPRWHSASPLPFQPGVRTGHPKSKIVTPRCPNYRLEYLFLARVDNKPGSPGNSQFETRLWASTERRAIPPRPHAPGLESKGSQLDSRACHSGIADLCKPSINRGGAIVIPGFGTSSNHPQIGLSSGGIDSPVTGIPLDRDSHLRTALHVEANVNRVELALGTSPISR